MISMFKRFLNTSILLAVIRYIFINWCAGLRYKNCNYEPASTPNKSFYISTNDYLANMERAFESYFENSNIQLNSINGINVLELGPGSSFAMALMFIANGANKVVCLDRFQGIRNNESERAVYMNLRNRLDDIQKERFDSAINIDNTVTVNTEKIVYFDNVSIEQADAVLSSDKFDLIISMAVLEHIYDGDAAFASMDRLLKSGGTMIHGVDLRDHGMFSRKGHHQLEFLTINDILYKMMSSNTGFPNRNLISFYRDKMIYLKYKYKIYIASVIGSEKQLYPHEEDVFVDNYVTCDALDLLHTIRPRLLQRFRAMPDKDLIVSTFVVSADKL